MKVHESIFTRSYLLFFFIGVMLSSGCVDQQDDIVRMNEKEEVAPLRGEVESAVHAIDALRSDLEGMQIALHSLESKAKGSDQEWKRALSGMMEELHQEQAEQQQSIQASRAVQSTFKEFSLVLDSLHRQLIHQASKINELNGRLGPASQAVNFNGLRTATDHSNVQRGVASLVKPLKESPQSVFVPFGEQDQGMSELLPNVKILSVRNAKNVTSSGDGEGLSTTVTQVRNPRERVTNSLRDRGDSDEKEPAYRERRQIVRLFPEIDPIRLSGGVREHSSSNVMHPMALALPLVPSKQQVSPLEQESYQAAFQLLKNQQPDLARAKFTNFLSQYPLSPLSPNAQYWKGECYYSSRQFQSAIREFELVLKHYPSDKKAPAALLKIGYSNIALHKPSTARSFFHQLVRRFPQSAEALKAYAKLTDVAGIPDRTS